MNNIVIRSFYLFLTILFLMKIPSLVSRDYTGVRFVDFAFIFNFVNQPYSFIFACSLLLIGALIYCTTSANMKFKALIAILFSALVFVEYSFGKANSGFQIWIIAAYLMIFTQPFERDGSRNKTIINLIQIFCLSNYFIAGLWKIRSFVAANLNFSLQEKILNDIAYSIAEGNGPVSFVLNILKTNPEIFYFGFILVLLFELTCLFPVFYNRYRPLWGYFIMAFHFATGLCMGIWFTHLSLAAFFFLVFIPKYEALSQS